jgi:hypothetical protein
MCFRISDMSLCKIEKKHTYTLNEVRINFFEFIKLILSILL